MQRPKALLQRTVQIATRTAAQRHEQGIRTAEQTPRQSWPWSGRIAEGYAWASVKKTTSAPADMNKASN